MFSVLYLLLGVTRVSRGNIREKSLTYMLSSYSMSERFQKTNLNELLKSLDLYNNFGI